MKILGFWFDGNLAWSCQVHKLIEAIKRECFGLRKLRNYFSIDEIFFNSVCHMLEFDWLSLSIDPMKVRFKRIFLKLTCNPACSDFVLSFVLFYFLCNIVPCFLLLMFYKNIRSFRTPWST